MTPGVVACPEPLAAEAGAEILRAGGNAVDLEGGSHPRGGGGLAIVAEGR